MHVKKPDFLVHSMIGDFLMDKYFFNKKGAPKGQVGHKLFISFWRRRAPDQIISKNRASTNNKNTVNSFSFCSP
jgi:hypothetical protein